MTDVAERLMFLMELRDMKQTELAEKVGISKQSLYKYLHCKCEPRAQIIAKMALVLETTADYIVGLTDNYLPKEYDETAEQNARRETAMTSKFMLLSPENQARIEERISILLENQL